MTGAHIPPIPPPPPKPKLESVTVRLPEALVAEVDYYAGEFHITRTAAIAWLLSFALTGRAPLGEKEKEVLRARAKRRREGK